MKIIPITLDRERHIRLNYNAICLFESVAGKSITALSDNPFISDMRALLYAALKWEDKSLTLDIIGELMDGVEDMEELKIKLGEALNDVFKARKNS